MKIYYHTKYNIDLGILNLLHPFDGKKFEHVFKNIKNLDSINIHNPSAPISQIVIDEYADSLLKLLLHKKRYILRALEIPYIPLMPFSFIDKHILLPMRWAVAGTLEATKEVLKGSNCWNLSGGYHHASRAAAEGFCIYNDIAITTDALKKEGNLKQNAKILIVDIDAHHGNGNAYIFMEDKNITILDIYNNDIYPNNSYTKERVDINIPLHSGTNGDLYISKLSDGLSKLTAGYDLAFVIAGTDVINADPLGGLKLTIEDCVRRDAMVLDRLTSLSTPSLFLGGGGYSKGSSQAITQSLSNLYKL